MLSGGQASTSENARHESALAVLEDTCAGVLVLAVEPGDAITAVAVQKHGGQAITLTYRRSGDPLGVLDLEVGSRVTG